MIEYPSAIPGSRTKIIDRVDFTDEKSLHHNPSSESNVFIMSGYEADGIVQSLETFPIEEIGSSLFMHMYTYNLERLSLQAHASATLIRSDPNLSTEDEFVVESILNFEKIPVLVQMLLTLELWRLNLMHSIPFNALDDERVCANYNQDLLNGSFLSYLASHGNTLRLSFILHTETTLVCLLTLVLFRRVSCHDMDCDTAIALVDYCARQMVRMYILTKVLFKNQWIYFFLG